MRWKVPMGYLKKKKKKRVASLTQKTDMLPNIYAHWIVAFKFFFFSGYNLRTGNMRNKWQVRKVKRIFNKGKLELYEVIKWFQRWSKSEDEKMYPCKIIQNCPK